MTSGLEASPATVSTCSPFAAQEGATREHGRTHSGEGTLATALRELLGEGGGRD